MTAGKKTQTVSWKIKTRGGANVEFTTIGYADTKAAADKWIGWGHEVRADWSWS